MAAFDRETGTYADIDRATLLAHAVTEGLQHAAEVHRCVLRLEAGALMVILGELERSLPEYRDDERRIEFRRFGHEWGLRLGERMIRLHRGPWFRSWRRREVEINISQLEAKVRVREWLTGLCPGSTL